MGDAVFIVLDDGAVTDTPAKGAIPTGTGIDSEGHSTGSFVSNRLKLLALSRHSFFYNYEDRLRLPSA